MPSGYRAAVNPHSGKQRLVWDHRKTRRNNAKFYGCIIATTPPSSVPTLPTMPHNNKELIVTKMGVKHHYNNIQNYEFEPDSKNMR